MTFFPAKIAFDEDIINGQIVNISKKGCMFSASSKNLSKFDKLLKDKAEVLITLFMPGVEEELSIDGKIKNVREKNNKLEIGTYFKNMDIITRTQIHEFISSSLSI